MSAAADEAPRGSRRPAARHAAADRRRPAAGLRPTGAALVAPLLAALVLIAGGLPRAAHGAPDAAEARAAAPADTSSARPARESTKPRPLDRTGKKRVGNASYYAKRFHGRKMADGSRMDPRDDNAASKTLPLGTKAKVTNLETGRSAVVTIQDRGPYVKGRIVDLSPATAEKIGIKKEEGVAKVEVAPIAVPQADGSVKPGAATATGASPVDAGGAAK